MTTTTASQVRCGNRKAHGSDLTHHASVADVRACFASSAAGYVKVNGYMVQPGSIAEAMVTYVPKAPVDEWAQSELDFASPEPAPAPASAGVFVLDDVIYRVRAGRTSKKLYAERIVVNGDHIHFVYAPGKIFKLTEANRMTAEEAQLWGKLHHRCVQCLKPLHVDASVFYNYGPVCAKNNGWPYDLKAYKNVAQADAVGDC